MFTTSHHNSNCNDEGEVMRYLFTQNYTSGVIYNIHQVVTYVYLQQTLWRDRHRTILCFNGFSKVIREGLPKTVLSNMKCSPEIILHQYGLCALRSLDQKAENHSFIKIEREIGVKLPNKPTQNHHLIVFQTGRP